MSLAEVDKGFQMMGENMKIVYKSKKVLIRAFEAAKGHCKSTYKGKTQDE